MRTWRGSVRFVLASLVALTAPPAQAQLLVATPPGDPPAVSHAELAYASGDGVPVTWLSLRLARGPVAVVAALPDDTRVETALDSWFAALEATASPNVLMPDQQQRSCKSTARFAHVGWPRDVGAPETALELQSAEDVQAALDEQGVNLSSQLPVAARYLVWSWAGSNEAQTTRTLRVLGGAAPLSLLPGMPFPVLVNAVTRGPVTLPGELPAQRLDVTFQPGEPAQSDYAERLRTWISARSEPLLEMRARAPLFDWTTYADTVSLAPLMQSYATRAAKELKGIDAEACREQLLALREPGAPAASACGEARDAELAVQAVGAEQLTLQRFALSGAAGLEPEKMPGGGDLNEPVLHATHFDDQRCEPKPDPVVVVDPPLRSGTDASQDQGSSEIVETPVTVHETTTPVEVSCGSSTESERRDEVSDDSGCSSDTSSTSSSDGDTRSDSCSGDSSSSSSSDDDTRADTCSGDSSSSSSSDTSDDSCSGDSSSSSSSDSSSGSGCSSDSSSGYDGDTCTASAAPGGEHTQKSQAGLHASTRPKRLKTSLWTLAFAAVMFPIRRRKRGL